MALNAYVSATQQLLSNPAAPTTLYSTSDITGYVNTARLQMAGECECVRSLVTLTITSATAVYPFTSFTNLPTGGAGIYNVRQMSRVSGTGEVYMGSRPYTWAWLYWLNNSSPIAAAPTEWSQYKIGSTGSLLVNPLPDTTYTAIADASIQPISLVTDGDAELIPYAYQDAVPFFAAFYAYLSAQRAQDAESMYARYDKFLSRAKKIAVPNVLSQQYDQAMPPPQAPQQAPGGM